MKPTLLLLTAILFSACAPAPVPATATSTLTLAPTRTPTLTPTATITLTPASSLPADFPPEFQAQIGDKDWQEVNGIYQVMAADGNWQNWYETKPDGKVQTTDWKMHVETEMQIGWEPKDQWNNYEDKVTSAYSWPVLTGEPAVTKRLILNGQEVLITGLPASIRDLNNPGKFIDVVIPKIFKDKFGNIILEIPFGSKVGEDWLPRTLEEIVANYKRGHQLELQMNIYYPQGRGVCVGNVDCEIQADLIAAQGLDLPNGVLFDGAILPVMVAKDAIEIGKYFR